jgi:hypothetical protein
MLLQRTLVFGTDSFGGGNYAVAIIQKSEKEHLRFVMDKQKFMREERLQQRNLHTNDKQKQQHFED